LLDRLKNEQVEAELNSDGKHFFDKKNSKASQALVRNDAGV